MARPIEHFKNIEDLSVRIDELTREIEKLRKVERELQTATSALADVSNPKGVGKSLDNLEEVRESSVKAYTTVERVEEIVQDRIRTLKHLRYDAVEECYG